MARKLPDSDFSVTMHKLALTGAFLRHVKHRTMKSTIATGRSSGPEKFGVPEILVWCALVTLCVAGHLFITHGPLLRNDSYQYLSAAENFLAGRPAYTSIVYFDSERSAGRIPAPLTTFPAGFSLATSVVAATGLPLQYSALVVSVSALALLIPVIVYAARLLAIGTFLTRALLIWFIGNSWVSVYGSAVAADSLYMLMSSTALTLFATGMIRADARSPRVWPFIFGSLFVGLSYWVRYAGLFLFVSTAAFFAVRSLIVRDKASRNATLTLGLAAAIIGAGFLRNELLVGTWKGGNDKVVHHSVIAVLHDFIIWAHHLLLGGIASARFSWPELVLAAGSLATGAAIALRGRGARSARARLPWSERLGPSALLLAYVAVYCAGMIYLGITSVISFETRMFYPLLPPALLLLARSLQLGEPAPHTASATRTMFFVGLSAATIGYLCIHDRSYFASLGPAPHELVARELSGVISPGMTMQSWIAINIPADETIIANQGQASGYVLHRKTLALVSQQYSDQSWGDAAVHSVMQIYDAHFLILYSGDAADDVLHDSAFLSALAHGSPPSWLKLVARSSGVAVFRVIT